MLSYYLKTSEREEGPFSEEQVSQLFAESRIDRHTSCRTDLDGSWKTIDDYLPMLKYGAPLASTPGISAPPSAPPTLPPLYVENPSGSHTSAPVSRNFALVDIDLPFGSILKLMFKWMVAAFLVICCFLPALIILFLLLMAIFGSFFAHFFSGFPRP